MKLKKLELSGFKSFAKTTKLEFPASVSAIVGPNGSGKSNISEAIRWVLGEQSMKSLRGKKGEDLIFNGSQTSPRLGKASVSLFFDNAKKNMAVDYDEVIITRKVFRDGMNEYYINSSQVRLKDIIEILSKVGLGTSSHHIIGQGEADRILNASMTERRQMIEDALGLKAYQIKKSESERKLAKTEENISQVQALRKEIQPHLKFLKKQVDKSEQAAALKDELKNLYRIYFTQESDYLESEAVRIKEEKAKPESEYKKIREEFAKLPEDSAVKNLEDEISELKKESFKYESEINGLRNKRNLTERELGRFEGMIEMEESRTQSSGDETVSPDVVYKFTNNLGIHIEKGLKSEDIKNAKESLIDIRESIKEFLSELGSEEKILPEVLNDLKKKKEEILSLLVKTGEQENKLTEKIAETRIKIEEKKKSAYGLEKERYEMESRIKELDSVLSNFRIREENIRTRLEGVENEKNEAGALVGEDALERIQTEIVGESSDEMKRKLERLKIKIEDSGGVGEEVLKEYEEVKKRDEFFEKEMIDLEQAIESLKKLLKELEEKIGAEFKIGIEKINKEFRNFFAAMFGGGSAELLRVAPKKRVKKEDDIGELKEDKQEEEKDEGIDVSINLPKKRIHSLDMLSGGERALTSIALLFAMSQVNPPPFLILDETDAALDEANSQKYGQMLKNLSKHTQLIIITHNRETMTQAGILYGVTMGSDGISKLLSIKFSEAERYTG